MVGSRLIDLMSGRRSAQRDGDGTKGKLHKSHVSGLTRTTLQFSLESLIETV